MANKYLVEFLAEWIHNQELRQKVLYKEVDEMDNWGLTAQQSLDLRSLKKADIMKRLEQELENDLGIDLQKILDDINNTGGQGPAAALNYEQDKVHVRGVEPKKIAKGVESIVIPRGHGWDDDVEVLFEPPGGGALVPGEVLDVDSDVDVWQRATVKVSLPTVGKWRVVVRVASKTQNPVSTESVEVQVV